jgi:hypothetical protein
VRPGTFGYYGTQWRRWPGQGVVPVSNEEAATPVVPPKSEVPSADEESMAPEPSELPAPDMPTAENGDLDRGDSGRGTPLPPEPEATPATTEPDVRPGPMELRQPSSLEPRTAPRADEAQPEAAPSKPGTGEDNLFDDSAARKIRRKIPVASGGQPARREAAGRVQQAAHELEEIGRDGASAARPAATTAGPRAAKPRTVPRVPFDPRAEAARMRQAR